MSNVGNLMSFLFYHLLLLLIPSRVCYANNNDPFNATTVPLRPPIPLFSASGEDFITVKVQLDQNDHRRSSLAEDGYVYELQSRESPSSGMEPQADFIWTRTQQMSAPPSASNSWMMKPLTMTAKELKSSTGYQFRLRIWSKSHNSPWSLPSEDYFTKHGILPPAKNLTATKVTEHSIKLRWNAPTLISEKVSPEISHYEVQYRYHDIPSKIHKGNNHSTTIIGSETNEWVSHPQKISAISIPANIEIQEITTLVDEDSIISSGEFILKLSIPSIPKIPTKRRLDSHMISSPIPFNATASEFENAISNIYGIGNVRVYRYTPGSQGASSYAQRGAYSWRVEIDTVHYPVPLFQVHRDDIDGTYQERNSRIIVKELQKSTRNSMKPDISFIIDDLDDYTYYDFRVRGVSEKGAGNWSNILYGVQTLYEFKKKPNPISPEQLNSNSIKMIQGENRSVANNLDPDYFSGVGMGGLKGYNGQNGFVVIIYSGQQPVPSRIYFFYNGSEQYFEVPESEYGVDSNHDQVYVTVKLWGAGGAGAGLDITLVDEEVGIWSENDSEGLSKSYGGGGGYVEAKIKVSPMELLKIVVGGGGKPSGSTNVNLGGLGGYNGGGNGGEGLMGSGGGGGGGASMILRGNKIIVAAGGGGGGGATDYCCAHGGAGGGMSGKDGFSPETPSYIGIDSVAEGMTRDEFTPDDCADPSCIDDRDKSGLPAFHQHLDRGFAPNASYHILSSGGKGGSIFERGLPGTSSEYIVYGGPTNALSGDYGFGGKGADGKEGGGGGGGGYYGGGGGGSGVDASGGGGGSGFIDYETIYVESIKCTSQDGLVTMKPPLLQFVKHNSVSITWSNLRYENTCQVGYNVLSFDVEISKGRHGAASEGGKCSDDYYLATTVLDNSFEPKMETTIGDLHPNTPYCVRLIAVADNSRSGISKSLEVSTLPEPQNYLQPVTSRQDLEVEENYYEVSKVQNTNESFFPCKMTSRPMPRRGHSLTFNNNIVILFGGISKACFLSKNKTKSMYSTENVYSNELWGFNPSTSEWKLFNNHSSSKLFPPGREQHSSTMLANGKMIVIGGLSSSNSDYIVNSNPLILGDIWELDMGNISSLILESAVNDDLPMNMIDGRVFYYPMDSPFTYDESGKEEEFCLHDIEVEVSLTHECIEQIGYISLFGPQNKKDLKHSWEIGSGIKMFIGSNIQSRCTPLTANITFSDKAEDSILDYSSSFPKSGTFQPAENMISQLGQKKMVGQWNLAIYDKLTDDTIGQLLDWKLKIAYKRCSPRARWKNLFKSSCENHIASHHFGKYSSCERESDSMEDVKESKSFSSRYRHTAIAVDNDVFVFGGFSRKRLDDIWKFHYESKTWIQLQGVIERRVEIISSSVLTPWGILRIGTPSDNSKCVTISRYDITIETWSEVEIDSCVHHKMLGFQQRRHYPITFVDSIPNSLNRHENDHSTSKDSFIILFGGDNDLPNHSYLSDLWLFSLRGLIESTQADHEKKYSSFCRWRIQNHHVWDASCGVQNNFSSVSQCQWTDVFLMAWCKRQYQSFISIV